MRLIRSEQKRRLLLKTRLDVSLHNGRETSSIVGQRRHDNGMKEKWDGGFGCTAAIYSKFDVSVPRRQWKSENCVKNPCIVHQCPRFVVSSQVSSVKPPKYKLIMI